MNKNVVESNVEPPSLPPMTKNWIYALRHCPTEQLQIEIETMKRLGFQRVAIDTIQPLDDARIDELSRTSHLLLQAGLNPVCLNVQLNGPFSPLDRARSHLKEEVKQLTLAIHAAASIGIKHIIIEVPPPPPSSNPGRFQDDLNAYALEAMQAIRYEAELKAISIAIVVGKRGVLNSAAESRDFIDECNSPWIGACLHLNEICPTDSPADWILSLGRRMFSCMIEFESPAQCADAALQSGLRMISSLGPEFPIILQTKDLPETLVSG